MRTLRIAVVVVLALAVAEGALRIARFGWTPAALGAWTTAPPWDRLRRFDANGDPEPRAGGRAAWALGPREPVIGYALNAVGLREDREVSPLPAPGTCRVLAIGDAYTFGYGVEADAAWPRVLERRLGRRGRVEVLNAGFPNLDVEQQRRRLQRLLPRLRPDVVIATFDWWNVPLEATVRPARWSVAWWIANGDEKAERIGTYFGLVHEPLRIFRATSGLVPPSGLARELEPLTTRPESLDGRWSRTRAALVGMLADADAASARFLLVVTPLDIQLDRRRNALYRDGRLPYPSHGFVDLDYGAARAMPEALARFARAERITLLDTTPAFATHGGARLFLAADYHAGPRGHRAVAREIARWFENAHPCAPARARRG